VMAVQDGKMAAQALHKRLNAANDKGA
jgi:hypothetical protein